MDELVDIDYELSERTVVCVVIPTRGESLNILREAILNAMSLNLWPGLLDVRKNARLVVVDDRRRAEVLLLIALCYRFAALFCNNRKVCEAGSAASQWL
jgi:predicted acyltransferase